VAVKRAKAIPKREESDIERNCAMRVRFWGGPLFWGEKPKNSVRKKSGKSSRKLKQKKEKELETEERKNDLKKWERKQFKTKGGAFFLSRGEA